MERLLYCRRPPIVLFQSLPSFQMVRCCFLLSIKSDTKNLHFDRWYGEKHFTLTGNINNLSPVTKKRQSVWVMISCFISSHFLKQMNAYASPCKEVRFRLCEWCREILVKTCSAWNCCFLLIGDSFLWDELCNVYIGMRV